MRLLGTKILRPSQVFMVVCLRVRSSTWPYSPLKSAKSPRPEGMKHREEDPGDEVGKRVLGCKAYGEAAAPAPARRVTETSPGVSGI